MIVFRGGAKVYAETPNGEWAFHDSQGLYEWRGSERIDYSGGDKQAATPEGRWTLHGRPEPRQRGIAAALDLKARMN